VRCAVVTPHLLLLRGVVRLLHNPTPWSNPIGVVWHSPRRRLVMVGQGAGLDRLVLSTGRRAYLFPFNRTRTAQDGFREE